MRMAVFGGTFNPIHVGHLMVMHEILDHIPLEKLLIIPLYEPVHKKIAGNIPPEMRLEMVKRAIQEDERLKKQVEIETYEIESKKQSYFVDTYHFLQKKYPQLKSIYLTLGDEIFNTFETWKDAEFLRQHVKFIIAARETKENEGMLTEALQEEKKKKQFLEKRMKNPQEIFLPNPLVKISSSMVRARIRLGRSIRYFVPVSVEEYIKTQKLYLQES